MLKLLIVDDEPFVREGLKQIINWNEYGFEICGEAQNGRIGLQMINDLKPDLVIIDIKMPGMDGLQVVETVRSMDIKCRFIILTGYADFNYAVKAISHNVCSYLLKPISQEELVDSINKVRDEIENELTANSILKNNINILIRRFIVKLINGQADTEAIDEAKNLFNIKLDWNSYQVILIDSYNKLDIEDEEIESGYNEFEDYIIDSNYGYCFESNGIFGLVVSPLKDELNLGHITLLREKLEKILNNDVIFAAGKKVEQLSDINISYKSACNLLANKFIFADNKIITEEVFKSINMESNTEKFKEDSYYEYINELKENLVISIDINDYESIENILNMLKTTFIKHNDSEDVIRLTYTNIYKEILQRLNSDNNYILDEVMQLNTKMVSEINSKKSLNELNEYIREAFKSISNNLMEKLPEAKMKKLISYIDKNCEKQLKLETLAQMFNYNSTYLGKQFKNYTGEYFNTYLHLVRIEKAKKLLNEGCKVNEVAKKLGYSSIDYFYSNFKKFTGESPSSYKK